MSAVVGVTGATGGLGRELVGLLVDRGHRVRAAVRSEAQAELARRLGAEPVRVDVTQPATLAPLVEGVDVVHHLAAWMGSPAGQAERVTVGGTRNVLEAAATAGVRRVVLASSVAVYGPVSSGNVTEQWPRRKVGDAYGDAKAAAEEAAESFRSSDASGMELVVLRPTMIYGPASGSWTITPVAGIRRGLPVVIGSGETLLDVVYVADVARAFAAAGEVAGAAGRVFNVTGASVSVNRFFGSYASIVDRPLRRLPLSLARAGVKAAAAVTGALPGVDRVAPETLATMTSAATFDGTAAREGLGYSPGVDLQAGMASTAAWLRESGLAPGPRSALVVGAARGLGREVARGLAERYVKVYAADLPPVAAVDDDATAAEAVDEPAGTWAGLPVAGVLEVDATSESSLAAAVAEVESREGHLDLTVTTVGGLRPGALEAQRLTDIESQLKLNALAPLLVARAASPGMRERGRGRIIAVGSTNGLLVTPFMGAYSAGKFALEAFSDALRLELLPFGVEVVLIEPGAMKTGFAAAAKRGLEAEAQRVGPPWADYLLRLRDSDLWGEKGAAEPESVAREIVSAAFRPRARSRHDATREVPLLKLFAKLPDAVKDRAFIRPLRLGRPRKER